MRKLTGAAICLAFLLSNAAVAQEKGKAKKASPKATAAAKNMGPYQGVTLSGGDPPPMQAPPAGVQYVTWPGFHADAAGSTIFLQLTGPVAYEQKRKKLKYFVTLMSTQVFLQNNLRPVLTQHFDNTPVKEFRLRQLKDGATRLEVTLSKKSAPTINTRTVGTFTYLVVSFPPLKK